MMSMMRTYCAPFLLDAIEELWFDCTDQHLNWISMHCYKADPKPGFLLNIMLMGICSLGFLTLPPPQENCNIRLTAYQLGEREYNGELAGETPAYS